MARTIREAKLETRTARGALAAAAKPYWRAIDEGLHLGYRKGRTAGKWVMRTYAGGQTYSTETIGVADDTIDADGDVILSFSQAQTKARHLFVERRRLAAGLPVASGPYTVKAAIDDYITWLEEHRKTGKDARWRADALILPELGAIAAGKLTTARIREWLLVLAKRPARIRSRRGDEQKFREQEDDGTGESARRRRASANRTLTILKAALNHAWRDLRKIPSDDAWRAVRPFREADAARVRYLTVAEAQRLVNAAEPDFRALVQAALQTGMRFGELGALLVADFNPDSGTLHVRTSKSGKGRHVVLTEEGIDLFRRLVAGRGMQEIMLVKADSSRWLKSHQARPMAEASARARIDPPVNFHALRHTYASLTIMNGAPLMVVARNLGHADTRMVEKHYGHLAPSFVADAIRAAAPRFGNVGPAKVLAIPSGRG